MPLPVPRQKPTTFGANDTSYVELFPVWNSAQLGTQLDYPADIVMGPDGILFLADKNNNRVLALSKAGELLTSENLDQITPIQHPYGLALDSKLNLFIANGSDTLYCWNQYLNNANIDSIAESGRYLDAATGNIREYTFSELEQLYLDGEPQLTLVDLIFKRAENADRVRNIYPFFIDRQKGAHYNGVAAGTYGDGMVYVTESGNNKIVKIGLFPQLAVRTGLGRILYQYKGMFIKNAVTVGSGAGTANAPYSIVCDNSEKLYFTQLDGNFKVQKLETTNFSPTFILYEHPIMDLDRFYSPVDIALDATNDIYVLDRHLGKVFKFYNSGVSAGHPAPLGEKGLAEATFNEANGLFVDDNVVYVVESGDNRIRRFQYTVSEADIPDDFEKP